MSPPHKTALWELSSDGQDTRTLSSGAFSSRIRAEPPRDGAWPCWEGANGHFEVSPVTQVEAWEGPEGLLLISEDLPGYFCTPHAFPVRQSLEAFGRNVVKNAFQENVCSTRREQSLLSGRNVTVSTSTGPLVRRKYNGPGKIEAPSGLQSPSTHHGYATKIWENRVPRHAPRCIRRRQI